VRQMTAGLPHRPGRILLSILSLQPGGAERVISEMANWWAARGLAVGVMTLGGGKNDHYELAPGVVRYRVDSWRHASSRLARWADLALLPFAVRKTVRSFAPEVVVSFIDLVNNIMAFSLAGSGVPLVVCERIDPRHHRISKARALARRVLYPLACALVVQTEAVAASWARRVVPAHKVAVIPNFVRDLPPRSACPGPQGVSSPYVLAVGRLDAQKGHDLLIRAFAKVSRDIPGWRLVILGEGPERHTLSRLASSLGMSDSVMMPGVVPEPAAWMYGASLFVHPSRYEGFPNALLEAMAAGCAVIAADCPSGPAEIVRHGVNGVLVPSDDLEALGTAMKTLMEDTKARERLGKEALKVAETFSSAAVMGAWDELLSRVTRKGDVQDGGPPWKR